MKKILYALASLLILHSAFSINNCMCQINAPVISNLTYDSITQTGVTVFWLTDLPTDSKIRWMASDSNYQEIIFTDSVYNSELVTNHILPIINLQPATIYKYNIISQNDEGIAVDSGYFVTQSESTGRVDVYFNHTVDTIVSTGENANGSTNFANLYIAMIDSAKYSIDITLWSFQYYTSISNALINAKNRGVKIRFVYNYTENTPLINSLLANGIPVIKRDYDTTYSMHNKFWIFDYRNNDDANKSFLLTGSANISHPQFHSDKNNIIIIQDESLCAVYTREFEEMWGSNTDQPDTTRAKFGAEKTDNTPHILDVAGTRMEVYFSPTDSVSAFISQLILTKPTHSLFFCMLKFELPAVEEALHSIYNNGINIKGVFDLANAFLPNSAFPRMNGNAVPNSWNPAADVFLDSISGLIHHKYLIIDPDIPEGNKIISTGSFNWEVPADIGNDENSLTIFDARVNNLYFQEFHQRYKESGGELILIHYASELLSSDLSQFQIYPNPFYSTTNINFEIVNSSFVKIIVYDILGREVQTLINKEISPGTYEAQFDGSSLNNGIYFCKIFAGDYSETERIMLLK